MAEHTPGPWKVDPIGVGTPWSIGTENVDIALANQIRGDDLEQHTRSANARLIASAPDLLAVLKAIAADDGEWHDGDGYRDVGGTPPFLRVHDIAANAVAKAEGR